MMFHCFKTGYFLSLVHEVRYLDTNFSHGWVDLERRTHTTRKFESEGSLRLYYDLSRTKVSKDKFTGAE